MAPLLAAPGSQKDQAWRLSLALILPPSFGKLRPAACASIGSVDDAQCQRGRRGSRQAEKRTPGCGTDTQDRQCMQPHEFTPCGNLTANRSKRSRSKSPDRLGVNFARSPLWSLPVSSCAPLWHKDSARQARESETSHTFMCYPSAHDNRSGKKPRSVRDQFPVFPGDPA